MLLGIVLIITPGAGALAITWAIGWWACLSGGASLWLAWIVHRELSGSNDSSVRARLARPRPQLSPRQLGRRSLTRHPTPSAIRGPRRGVHSYARRAADETFGSTDLSSRRPRFSHGRSRAAHHSWLAVHGARRGLLLVGVARCDRTVADIDQHLHRRYDRRCHDRSRRVGSAPGRHAYARVHRRQRVGCRCHGRCAVRDVGGSGGSVEPVWSTDRLAGRGRPGGSRATPEPDAFFALAGGPGDAGDDVLRLAAGVVRRRPRHARHRARRPARHRWVEPARTATDARHERLVAGTRSTPRCRPGQTSGWRRSRPTPASTRAASPPTTSTRSATRSATN